MKKMLILMMGAMLLLSACSEGDTNFISTTPFLGGTEGLKISFIDNFPPSVVGDGGTDEFDVIVEVDNRGEHEVPAEDVLVRLSGFSPNVFNKAVDDLSLNLPSALEANEKASDGTRLRSFPLEIEFNSFNYQGRVQGNQQVPLRAEICYTYTTQVISSLCIKSDYRRDNTGDICAVDANRQVFNSAGPIQVVSARQTPSGEARTRITYVIENKDNGRVFQTGSACRVDDRDQNRVFVRVTGLGEGESADCNLRGGDGVSGDVVLDTNGRAEFVCTFDIDERSIARPQNYGLSLTYNYNEHIQTTIVVENS